MKLIKLMVMVATFAVLLANSTPMQASEMDAQIETSAENLYVFKTFLKGDDVTIHSDDGVVTLTGTVSDESRRILAEETMANVSGVKSVTNELLIEGEQDDERSDFWLAAKVKTALVVRRSVSGIDTEVSVENGVVTLSGEADNQAQIRLTTEYAKDIDGVKDVINEMTVAKAPKKEKETLGTMIDDASITAQIKYALLVNRSTRVLKTQVKTDDGVVTLSGMAKNDAEKELVTKLVNDIRGVTSVNNRMTVEKSKAQQ
jgi:hyperosmotically inducible periplasmic protein